jgi:hypothetical protein
VVSDPPLILSVLLVLNYFTYFSELEGLTESTLIPLLELTRISLADELFFEMIYTLGVLSALSLFD